jgi:selenocysteine lyase/cysteine desulfurase
LVSPVHRLAEKVHGVGGRILVDAAQLAAHRPIVPDGYVEPLLFDLAGVSD